MKTKGPFEKRAAKITVVNDAAYLETHNGFVVTVDFEDLPKIANGYGLYVSRESTGYLKATVKLHEETHAVARLVMEPAHGQCVDHINRNTLDNRKSNLRCCTHAQNVMNRNPNRNGRNRLQDHPYKGVRYNPKMFKPFSARIMLKRKEYRGGSFDTAEEAARAYDELARKYHGEFARLNFPDK